MGEDAFLLPIPVGFVFEEPWNMINRAFSLVIGVRTNWVRDCLHIRDCYQSLELSPIALVSSF